MSITPQFKDLRAFEQRLILETRDLSDRIDKLSVALAGDNHEIREQQMDLLQIQLKAMVTLRSILGLRVKQLNLEGLL